MARTERHDGAWESASVGIATFAAILAAATSAGIFAVISGLFTPEAEGYPTWLKGSVAFLAVTSLLAYLFTLASSLAVYFRRTPDLRRTVFRNAAVAVFVQAYVAVLAVLLIILWPFLEELQRLV